MKNIFLALLTLLFLASCTHNENLITETANPIETQEELTDEYIYDNNDFKIEEYLLKAPLSVTQVTIDGIADDDVWTDSKWNLLNHRWLGKPYTKEDFQGRYKLAWDPKKLYLLVEITDDIIIDKNEKWDDGWWNDDCVEIFIDEDNGDDLHQFNHKAFAYHLALNARDVVDLGTDSLPHLYNNHIKATKIMKNDKQMIWEIAIDIYDDTYQDGKKNTPVILSKGKEMGFALAYCDSDTSATRENFIGSIPMKGTTDVERDQGWKDAGVFNTLILK